MACARSVERLCVLDVSAEALRAAKQRLGARSSRVTWIVADVTNTAPVEEVFVWHDRAVLHFLTKCEDRATYSTLANASIVPGGYAVIATFAPDGPTRCSGLLVQRHDGTSIAELLGADFVLLEEEHETHVAPNGAVQLFCWAVLQKRIP
jgi:hypothetical protein